VLPGMAKPFCNSACVINRYNIRKNRKFAIWFGESIYTPNPTHNCFAAGKDDPMKFGVFFGFPMKSGAVF